jgi:hypothetical protein
LVFEKKRKKFVCFPELPFLQCYFQCVAAPIVLKRSGNPIYRIKTEDIVVDFNGFGHAF